MLMMAYFIIHLLSSSGRFFFFFFFFEYNNNKGVKYNNHPNRQDTGFVKHNLTLSTVTICEPAPH